MNLQERLEQCRKDKAAIEKEEQELLRQIKQGNNTFASTAKILPEYDNGRLILHLTPEFVKTIQENQGKFVSIDSKGKMVLTSDYLKNVMAYYSAYHKQIPIFKS